MPSNSLRISHIHTQISQLVILCRQLSLLRPTIRAHPLVRLVVALQSAMLNRNFTRFFRLTRQRATLLQACVVHRYLPHLRRTALLLLARAFGPRQKDDPILVRAIVSGPDI